MRYGIWSAVRRKAMLYQQCFHSADLRPPPYCNRKSIVNPGCLLQAWPNTLANGANMEHAGFFHKAGPFTLSAVAEAIGASLSDADESAQVEDLRPLRMAASHDLTFFENRKYFQ